MSLIHATPYQPEGKGKCERWFKTVRENFLPQLSLSDLESLEALNEALHAWIDGYYHRTPHSTTGEPPLERFIQHLKAARPAPEHLEAMFRNRALRKVGKDRVVSLNGRAFEAPIGSIGKKLELKFDPTRPDEVEAFDGPKSLGLLKLVLPHSNAKIKRSKRDFEMEPSTQKNTPPSGKVPFGQ
ncbi:MAG: transposase [Deltaproteobacteria bacterium]|nr:transposase [Deltaproteobacteria bacterium]